MIFQHVTYENILDFVIFTKQNKQMNFLERT